MNPTDEKKTIYQLSLHEKLKITERLMVTRVPGGWLYTRLDPNDGCSDQTVFVPFSNEFMK